jgi:2,3-bisphosphoglycerate-dependent phosphoglycerate mutase
MKNFFLILFTLFQIKNIFTNNKFLSFINKEKNLEKIDKKYKLVLIRHGQSSFNQENLFTGWTDVDLTDIGVEEAKLAGKILKENSFRFDKCYTSSLKRSIKTSFIILDKLDQLYIPIIKDFHLNERHYGAIQGLNKRETSLKYGKKLVYEWRRSYSIPPPKLSENDERNPANIEQYKNINKTELPLTESLEDTVKRVLPYFYREIIPEIKKGKKILVVAHGNSIRGLIKYFDNLSDEEIVNVDIPNAVPLVYEFNENFEIIKRYYLGDEKEINEKIKKIKRLEKQLDNNQ